MEAFKCTVDAKNEMICFVFLQFFIEANTGFAPHSNIAIDDILVEDGPCGSKAVPAGIGSSNKKPNPPGAVVTEGNILLTMFVMLLA